MLSSVTSRHEHSHNLRHTNMALKRLLVVILTFGSFIQGEAQSTAASSPATPSPAGVVDSTPAVTASPTSEQANTISSLTQSPGTESNNATAASQANDATTTTKDPGTPINIGPITNENNTTSAGNSTAAPVVVGTVTTSAGTTAAPTTSVSVTGSQQNEAARNTTPLVTSASARASVTPKGPGAVYDAQSEDNGAPAGTAVRNVAVERGVALIKESSQTSNASSGDDAASDGKQPETEATMAVKPTDKDKRIPFGNDMIRWTKTADSKDDIKQNVNKTIKKKPSVNGVSTRQNTAIKNRANVPTLDELIENSNGTDLSGDNTSSVYYESTEPCSTTICNLTCKYGKVIDSNGCVNCECKLSDACPPAPKASKLLCMMQFRLTSISCKTDSDCPFQRTCCPGLCGSTCRRLTPKSMNLSFN